MNYLCPAFIIWNMYSNLICQATLCIWQYLILQEDYQANNKPAELSSLESIDKNYFLPKKQALQSHPTQAVTKSKGEPKNHNARARDMPKGAYAHFHMQNFQIKEMRF